MFDLFWTKFSEDNDIEDPELPRRRRRPARLEDGNSAGHYHISPKDYYRQLYYEAIDSSIGCLTNRFDQPDYKKYCQLEQLLIKASVRKEFEEEFQFVSDFYKEDFNLSAFRAQLVIFGIDFQQSGYNSKENITIFDIKAYFVRTDVSLIKL